MRHFWIAFATLALMTSVAFPSARAAGGATITSQELDRVFAAIKQNKWKLVDEQVLPLIERPSQAQRYLIARLRYIYLIALAKQLETKTPRSIDLEKKLKILENRLIVQPWHPVSAKPGRCLNYICPTKDNPSVLMTAQTNARATQIYSIEYFDMGAPIDISSFEGENARLGGVLEKIEINENLPKAERTHSGVSWFFSLRIKDGYIDYER